MDLGAAQRGHRKVGGSLSRDVDKSVAQSFSGFRVTGN